MTVEKITIHPDYKANGTWALATQTLLPPDAFTPMDQAIIWVPPSGVAADHRHARREALVGIGPSAYFVWQDETRVVHETPMNPDGEHYLFIIPGGVPHAVVNKSPRDPVVLYEYFDDIYRGVEKTDIVRKLQAAQ